MSLASEPTIMLPKSSLVEHFEAELDSNKSTLRKTLAHILTPSGRTHRAALAQPRAEEGMQGARPIAAKGSMLRYGTHGSRQWCSAIMKVALRSTLFTYLSCVCMYIYTQYLYTVHAHIINHMVFWDLTPFKGTPTHWNQGLP